MSQEQLEGILHKPVTSPNEIVNSICFIIDSFMENKKILQLSEGNAENQTSAEELNYIIMKLFSGGFDGLYVQEKRYVIDALRSKGMDIIKDSEKNGAGIRYNQGEFYVRVADSLRKRLAIPRDERRGLTNFRGKRDLDVYLLNTSAMFVENLYEAKLGNPSKSIEELAEQQRQLDKLTLPKKWQVFEHMKQRYMNYSEFAKMTGLFPHTNHHFVFANYIEILFRKGV